MQAPTTGKSTQTQRGDAERSNIRETHEVECIDYGAVGCTLPLCLSAPFHKSTSTCESFYMTCLCVSLKPPLQLPSARPETLLRPALAPSPRQRPLHYIHFPSQQAFVRVTLKRRAVFQRPADAICKDMRAFLWVPRYEVMVLAAHLAVSQSSTEPMQQQVQLRARRAR